MKCGYVRYRNGEHLYVGVCVRARFVVGVMWRTLAVQPIEKRKQSPFG